MRVGQPRPGDQRRDTLTAQGQVLAALDEAAGRRDDRGRHRALRATARRLTAVLAEVDSGKRLDHLARSSSALSDSPKPRPSCAHANLGRERFAFLLNLPAGLVLLAVLAWPVLYAGWLSAARGEPAPAAQRASCRSPASPTTSGCSATTSSGWRCSTRSCSWPSRWRSRWCIGLGIALVIDDERVALSRVTRVLMLVPWGVPPVVNGLLWSFIFNAQYGYLNRTLLALGLIHEHGQLAGRSLAGDGGRDHRLRLAHHAVQHPALPRRASGHSRATATRRPRGRRLGLAAVLAHHAAAAPARHRRHPDPEDDLRLHGLRRDLRDHPGRPGQCDLGGRLVHLPHVVPAAVQHRPRLRLRLGDGADPRRDSLAYARWSTAGWRPDGVGRLSTASGASGRLWLANLAALAFLLLPLVPVVLGALHSEKSAHGRHPVPAAGTAHAGQLPADPLRRCHRGPIFEQVTYLPKSIERFATAFLNSLIVASSVARLTLALASLSAYTVARLNVAWMKAVALAVAGRPAGAAHRADGAALRPVPALRPAQLAERRRAGRGGLPAALRHPHPGPVLRLAAGRSWRTPRASTAARASARSGGSCCPWPRRASPPAP